MFASLVCEALVLTKLVIGRALPTLCDQPNGSRDGLVVGIQVGVSGRV